MEILPIISLFLGLFLILFCIGFRVGREFIILKGKVKEIESALVEHQNKHNREENEEEMRVYESTLLKIPVKHLK